MRHPTRWSILFSVAVSACALNARPALGPAQMAELWEDPVDLERRDLLFGPGGSERAPRPSSRYDLVKVDAKGFSPGYDVKDEQGQTWSVKLGPEARTEVVVSRLIWAAGYHQPDIYYLSSWTLTDKETGIPQTQARFRLEPPSHQKIGTWSWRNNPFRDTQHLAGLFVLMVMVNNWDVKAAQNVVYRVEREGADPIRWFVVKDLGASLGSSNWFFPGVRDNVEKFEKEPFIAGVEGNRVKFHYQGAWREPQVFDSVAPEDVRWVCSILARLTPDQWMDAFRAGGYSAPQAERYIHRLKERVADGLRL
jgi:hypothetical protein